MHLKGEEIMNTYGALDNASLVRMYGFAEHSNPNNTVSDDGQLHIIIHHTIVGTYSSATDQTAVS